MLAQSAGYDGVEIMGSGATSSTNSSPPRPTNARRRMGRQLRNRMRFPRWRSCAARAARGANFILIFRLSMLDLVKGGSTHEEVVQLAQALEKAGVTILNTGIGWHEARIPTIATRCPAPRGPG